MGLAMFWPAMSGAVGQVGQDIAEHIFCRDYIKIPRPAHQAGGAAVNQNGLIVNLRVFLGHLFIYRLPQHAGLHSVGLVYHRDVLFAAHGQVKRTAGVPLDL